MFTGCYCISNVSDKSYYLSLSIGFNQSLIMENLLLEAITYEKTPTVKRLVDHFSRGY